MSPHVLPPSIEKSYPHLLNPMRELFCPAIKLSGLVGLMATTSSACRRNEQSWFTRVLVIPPLERTFEQPRVACIPLKSNGAANAAMFAFARLVSAPLAPRREYIAPDDRRGSFSLGATRPLSMSRARSEERRVGKE